MTDQLTPDRIKAFIDDLARLSLRHGIVIGATYGGPALQVPDDDFDGYSVRKVEITPGEGLDLVCARWDNPYMRDGYHISLDLTKLSAHERLKIMGGKS